MSKKIPELEVLRIFERDAADMMAARHKASIIHHTKDIDTAGNEVEECVRSVFRSRLPMRYHAGHGHIVDPDLRTSEQLDVVISDALNAGVLFRAADGTEYFPFESVYAVGEIKSTYDPSKEPIEVFGRTIQSIRRDFHRNSCPLGYLDNGVILSPDFAIDFPLPVRNPFFSFMLFLEGSRFDPQAIAQDLSRRPAGTIPNVICVLDRCLLLNYRLKDAVEGAEFERFNIHPEYLKTEKGFYDGFGFLEFGAPEVRLASNWMALYFVIMWHLTMTTVMPPLVHDYLTNLLKHQMKFPKPQPPPLLDPTASKT